MLVATGKEYRTRSGKTVGPLRPYIENVDDGPSEDIRGNMAWFTAPGIGSYGKDGTYLAGRTDDPMDIVAELGEDDAVPVSAGRQFTTGLHIGIGLLLAEVAVTVGEVTIIRAWIEPKGAPETKLPVEGAALDTLGAGAGNKWQSLRVLLVSRARSEVPA